jgi:TM2 domain-containing membrane protein YozV
MDLTMILIIIGAILGLVGLGIGVFYLKKKVNIYDDILLYTKAILPIVLELNSNMAYEYKEKIDAIITYCIDAFEFVDSQDDIGLEDLDEKITLAIQKVYEIADESGVLITEEFKNIVSSIFDIIKLLGLV